jgi:hypothetical protein
MDSSAWVLAGANALAASTLLTAGIGKQVAPVPVGVALGELFPVFSRALLTKTLRVFAAVEVLVAMLLLFGDTRLAAAAATSLLGLCFVVVGLRGEFSRSTAPCGCFGSASHRPLGWVNVVIGLALAVTGPVNALLTSGAEYQAGAALLTVVGSIGLSVLVHRRLIARLGWPASGTPAGSEVH